MDALARAPLDILARLRLKRVGLSIDDFGTGHSSLAQLRDIPFFAYPPEVRKIIYTTNAIESMHMQLRKIVKNRGHFPSDEAASKLPYLALRNIEKDWKMPPVTWKQVVNQLAILFGERFTKALN